MGVRCRDIKENGAFVLPEIYNRRSSRLPHQPYSDVMTNLTLRPFWATRLVGCVPGVKPRAESLNRFAVNPTDSWAKSSYAFGVADLSPLTTVSGVISETP